MPVNGVASDTTATRELLEGLMATFEADPVLSVASLEEVYRSDPQQFSRSAFPLLYARATPGERQVLFALIVRVSPDTIADFLTDASLIDAENARVLARSLGNMDAHFAVRLLKFLKHETLRNGDVAKRTERVLELVGALPEDEASVPYLVELARSDDHRIRSRASLMMARGDQTVRAAEMRMADPDARVRANAIEGLWRAKRRGAEHVLNNATRDAAARVAVNAWVGLYYLGDTGAAAGLLNLSGHQEPGHRAATAWGMGHLGDATFQPQLQLLVRDPDASVRRNALKALVKIRKQQEVQNSGEGLT